MRVRQVKVKGLRQTEHAATVPTDAGVTAMGAGQVNVAIRAETSPGIPEVFCRVMMSTEEAREFGERMIREADKAERMAAQQDAQKERLRDRALLGGPKDWKGHSTL